MEMGFSAAEADAAVRQNPGNMQDAINSLLSGTADTRASRGARSGGARDGGGGRSQRANGEHQPPADRERGGHQLTQNVFYSNSKRVV